MSKKILTIITAVCMLFTACSSDIKTGKDNVKTNTSSVTSSDEKLSVPNHTDFYEDDSIGDASDTDNGHGTFPLETPDAGVSADGSIATDGVDFQGTAMPSATQGIGSSDAAGKATADVMSDATAKPVVTGSLPTTSSPNSTGNAGSSTKTPTATKSPTATAKPTATVKPTSTTKPTATVKPTTVVTPTPTQKVVTYHFEPSSINIYAGQEVLSKVSIYDSNGTKVTDWSNFQLYGYTGVEVYLSNKGTLTDYGELGTSVITVQHKVSGQKFSVTVNVSKNPKYLAYYPPYNMDAIQADMKAYVESHNGIWNYLATPETSGYYPGISDVGDPGWCGESMYCGFLRNIDATVIHIVSSEDYEKGDWTNVDLYVHWQLTSGISGTSSARYLVNFLYGSSVGPDWNI